MSNVEQKQKEKLEGALRTAKLTLSRLQQELRSLERQAALTQSKGKPPKQLVRAEQRLDKAEAQVQTLEAELEELLHPKPAETDAEETAADQPEEQPAEAAAEDDTAKPTDPPAQGA